MKNKLNQAIISLGGKGTRLNKITNDIPKPLWPIMGTSTLERAIKNLREFGITRYIFLLNFKAYYFKKEKTLLEKKYNIQISIYEEETPKGEAGALIDIENYLDENFLFINGDIVFRIDINKIYAFHTSKKADLTFVTHTSNHPDDSDCIVETPSLSISKFKFKNNSVHNKFFYLGNAGFSIVSKKIISFIKSKIKDEIKELSFFKHFLIQAHLNKFKVFSYNTSEYLCDMGTPERLRKVESDIKNNFLDEKCYSNPQKVLFIDRDNTIIKCSKGSYILSEKDIILLKENIHKLAILSKDFSFVILISNQPQIAMGFTSWQNVININGEIIKICLANNLLISCFYICPHHPHIGFSNENQSLKTNCFCRKPYPGMFLEAAFNRNINLEESLMVGDSEVDREAAKNAGVPFKWIYSI